MSDILISVGGALALVAWGMWQGLRRIRVMENKIPLDTVGNDTVDRKLQTQRDSLQQEFGVLKLQLESELKTLSHQNAEQAIKIKNLEDSDKSKERKINELNERIVGLTESLDTEKLRAIEAEKRATQAEKDKTALATQFDKDKSQFTTEIAVMGAKLEILEKVLQNPAPIRFVFDTSMLNGELKSPVENDAKGVE